MSARVLVATLLCGCISWTQAEPGPGCDPESSAPYTAAGLAVVSAAFATLLFATQKDKLDIEQHTLGVFAAAGAIGWSVDALNARADRSACRTFVSVNSAVPARK